MKNLSPAQLAVVEALATGSTVTAAAAQAGVSRPTVHSWLRSNPDFQQALDTAKQEFALTLRDRLQSLAIKALDKIEALLDDPNASPSVKLKAALAILQRQQWNLPAENTANTSPEHPEQPGQPEQSETMEELYQQALARSAPCPCGSGAKYKRCCGKNAPPLLHHAA